MPIENNTTLNPFIEKIKDYIIYPKNSKWGRLVCKWNEYTCYQHHYQTHTYAACVNLEKKALYLDCRPRKIFAKCAAAFIARPAFTLIKTIYHISLVEIPYQLYLTTVGAQPLKKSLIKCAKNIADIVRTPIYGVALMAATLGVMILGVYNPESLYSGREFLGQLEQRANWGEAQSLWTMAACFQPFPLDIIESKYSQFEYEDTFYENSNDPIEIGLANFAHAVLYRRRTHYNPFDQICGTLDPNIAYKSLIFS